VREIVAATLAVPLRTSGQLRDRIACTMAAISRIELASREMIRL
jgi:hypothetical protein